MPGAHTLSHAIKLGRTLHRTTGHKVTWENYLEWRRSHPSATPDNVMISPEQGSGTTSSGPEEQANLAQLTFQQITDLINAGQTHLIPNNRVIPEAIHVGVPCPVTPTPSCL